MTLLDLVVHVPVNCGSVCADTKDISSALTASDDRSDKVMKYGGPLSNQVSKLSVETGKRVTDIIPYTHEKEGETEGFQKFQGAAAGAYLLAREPHLEIKFTF